jgi:hypothetical protein
MNKMFQKPKNRSGSIKGSAEDNHSTDESILHPNAVNKKLRLNQRRQSQAAKMRSMRESKAEKKKE